MVEKDVSETFSILQKSITGTGWGGGDVKAQESLKKQLLDKGNDMELGTKV